MNTTLPRNLRFVSILIAAAIAFAPGVVRAGGIEDRLRARLGSVEGRWALYFQDLSAGETITIDADAVFDAASVMKVLVLAKALHDVEQRRYGLKDMILVRDEFPSAAPGGGTFVVATRKRDEVGARVGRKMTLERLLHYMITKSNNLATNVVMQKAGGPAAVAAYAQTLGMSVSAVRRYLMEKADYDPPVTNHAQPREYGALMAKLGRQELASPAIASQMTDMLVRTGRTWLAKGIPRRVRFAHKKGSLKTARHDAGVFFLPDGRRFVLCVFSDGLTDTAAAEEALADVGEMLYRHVRDRPPAEPSPEGDRKGCDAGGPQLEIRPANWYEQASTVTDRETIAAAFKKAHYWPPEPAFVMIARVLPGVGQPSYDYYSLKDTGFVISEGHFTPASAVKVMVSVGALWTLARHGLTGEAHVSFQDAHGPFRGPAWQLYRATLRYSSNGAYNHLMAIAGLEEMLTEYFVPESGFPHTVIQVGYGDRIRGRLLNESPEIAFRDGEVPGTIPARTAAGWDDRCPKKNCMTLFELQDSLRRVILHEELAPADRFPISDGDVRRMRAVMLETGDFMRPGPQRALGHPVRTYNKVGYIPGLNLLENAVVEDTVTGRRYLVAGSVPFKGTMEQMRTFRATLAKFVQKAMEVVLALPEPDAGLQFEHGGPFRLTTRCAGSRPGAWEFAVEAPEAETLEAWDGRTPIAPVERTANGFRFVHRFDAPGRHVVMLRTKRDGRPVGYRAVTVQVPDLAGEGTTP